MTRVRIMARPCGPPWRSRQRRDLATRWAVGLVAVFITPYLAGCGGGGGSGSSSTTTTAAIGYVKQAANQSAIPGATVTIGTRSAITASDGRYRISGLSAGALARSVSAAGYNNYSDAVTMQPGVNVLPDVLLVEGPPPPPPPPAP